MESYFKIWSDIFINVHSMSGIHNIFELLVSFENVLWMLTKWLLGQRKDFLMLFFAPDYWNTTTPVSASTPSSLLSFVLFLDRWLFPGEVLKHSIIKMMLKVGIYLYASFPIVEMHYFLICNVWWNQEPSSFYERSLCGKMGSPMRNMTYKLEKR